MGIYFIQRRTSLVAFPQAPQIPEADTGVGTLVPKVCPQSTRTVVCSGAPNRGSDPEHLTLGTVPQVRGYAPRAPDTVPRASVIILELRALAPEHRALSLGNGLCAQSPWRCPLSAMPYVSLCMPYVS